MNRAAAVALFFDECHTVVTRPIAWRVLGEHSHVKGIPPLVMPTACLTAALESICARELATCVDPEGEIVVGIAMDCRHCGLIPAGARVRVAGWVEHVGDREVTFWVYAQDEHEEVCQGTIRLAIVPREQAARAISRKAEAIARRELFAPA